MGLIDKDMTRRPGGVGAPSGRSPSGPPETSSRATFGGGGREGGGEGGRGGGVWRGRGG